MLATRMREAAAGAGVSSDWWETGGVSSAVCVYQPKGAASYAASLTDLSGNGNDATEGTAPAWASNTGWTFDSISDYLLVPSLGISGSANRTVIASTYLTAASPDSQDYVFCFGPDASTNYASFRVRWNTGNILRMEIEGTGYNSSLTLNGQTNYIVAARLDGTTLADVSLFIDGSKEDCSGTETLNTVEGGNVIGSHNNSSLSFYAGIIIRAFAVYDAALTDGQIDAIGDEMAAL